MLQQSWKLHEYPEPLRKTCRLKRRCKQARKQSSARQGFVHWRQNTSSHAIFSQFLLVTPAHALFFLKFFTFTRTCVAQALSKLCSSYLCAVYKSLFRPHTMTLLGVPHTTSSFCSTPPSLSPNRLHTDWSQESTERHSAVGRTVSSSGRHNSIHRF